MDKENLTYPEQHHRNFMNILNDPLLYLRWVNKRAGMILADNLLTKGYEALEIGCGNGCNFHLMKNAKRIHAIDIDPAFIKFARSSDIISILPKNVILELECIDALKFKPRRNYDLILSVYALWDRIPVTFSYVQELLSHLNPGGFFFIYTLVHENLFYFEYPNFTKSIKSLVGFTVYFAKTFTRKLARKLSTIPSSRQRERLYSYLSKNNLVLANETVIRYAKGRSLALLWHKPLR